MRGDSHAGFGGRLAETERPKGRHRAAGRPYLSTEALDEVRRETWNDARKAGQPGLARELKGARFALWMNPDRLTERHQQKLARVQQINKDLLEAWLKWARRCRLQSFVKLAKTITKQRPEIEAALSNELSNARTEQVNTQIRLITPRRGFGYHSPWAVIALAMLSLGALCPPLPGR